MEPVFTRISRRLTLISLLLGLLLALTILLGVSLGSTNRNPFALTQILAALTEPASGIEYAIIRQIRLPRVLLAAMVGATLSLGGLVFQVLLRNPLAEPYILGVSGGAAVGAVSGMLAGLPFFPGVTFTAFTGSMTTLGAVLLLAGGPRGCKDSLLLAGVMINSFAGALIMFLIYLSESSQLHHILFWLMGDLSMAEPGRLSLFGLVFPCYLIIILLSRPMNALLTGLNTAVSLGVDVWKITGILLIATTFMVSIAVSISGLVGFVGLVIPHILRLITGPDNRLLVPSCILGGASYLVLCDLVARTISTGGELPAGIITAMIGAPLFISLLWSSRR